MGIGNLFRGFRFYFLSGLYLFVVFGAMYGFFVDEISVFQYSVSGWPKNLLCLFGLFGAAAIAAYPLVLAVYRALSANR